MSAFKSNSRGTFVLKARYPGVPPIRRASGTTNPDVLERLHRMLDALYEQARHDILEGIATGRLKPLQVLTRFRLRELDRLPHADLLPPLLATFKAWAETAEGSEEHRRSRLKAWKRWGAVATEATTVGELPAVLREDRVRCAAHAVTFNNGRAAAMAFVRDRLSKRHALHDAVADVPLLKATRKRRRIALSVEQLREAVRVLGPGLGGMAWTMAVTGMGNKEYWTTPWFVYAPTHVVIEGSKREGRDRLVPYVSPLTAPQCQEKAFGKRIRELRTAGKLPAAVTIYSLRRTFAVILSNAGVDKARRRIYMGHAKAASMTEFYEMSQEIVEYLAEDSRRIRAYLGETGGALKVMA